jgi:hypothetical protein
MKIIDAPWEEKSIGLKTVEIIFENSSEQLPYDEINGYQHIVAKALSTEIKTVHMLEQNGFEFIESQLTISKAIKGIKFDPFIERIAGAYELKMIESDDEMQIILNAIGNGLFNTDRIYLDPAFGKELAIKRYKNWADFIFQDKENQRVLMIINKKNKVNVGFICLKTADQANCEIPLAGIFEEHKKLNIGFLVIYYPLLFALNNGFKYCRTAISLNNIKIVNLYSFFGYQINKTYSVLRKVKLEKNT